MRSPALDSDGVTVYQGDALTVLGELPDESVDVVLTSPPYWSLRDYGDPDQLGLEETPELYIERLVGIFAEARRVLRDTGTLWVVVGDSYMNNPASAVNRNGIGSTSGKFEKEGRTFQRGSQNRVTIPPGLKPKDLVMVPARLALALQADGWYLRKDIIWHKPNPMPESVRDRPTSSHEHVLMLAKSQRYHYDQAAALEAYRYDGRRQTLIAGTGAGSSTHANYANRRGAERWPRRSGNSERNMADGRDGDRPADHLGRGVPWVEGEGRNLRDVWTIETEPTPLEHYATYPQALCDPIIRVASPPGGTILDPFFGSGTTALVARRHGRRCIGVELNAEYVRIAGLRLAMPDVAPLIPVDEPLQLQLGEAP